MIFQNEKKIRENLLNLFSECSDACIAKISDLSRTEAGLKDLAFCFEALGFKRVNLLLRSMPKEEWTALVDLTQPFVKPYDARTESNQLNAIYLMFVAYCLSWDPVERSNGNSFEFLRTLTLNDLSKLFNEEDPVQVSLLSTLMSPYQMSRVISALPKDNQELVGIAIQRQRRLPKTVLVDQAIQFLSRIKEKVILAKIEKANAREKIEAAIASIDTERTEEINSIIEKEMPGLKKLLDQNGYTGGEVILSRGINRNGK